jgi:hypothetical protein
MTHPILKSRDVQVAAQQLASLMGWVRAVVADRLVRTES